jgi:hypothetical protein
MQAPDTAARIDLLHAFLAPRWHAARGGRDGRNDRNGRVTATWRYADWTRALALQAALSAPGRSLRQVQRRIRGWAGLPLQRLERMRREECFWVYRLWR